MLASSLGIYNAEHEAQPDVYRNAFSGIWWSVSTLLTVGYGDIYPVTTAGKDNRNFQCISRSRGSSYPYRYHQCRIC
ncbi:potassium channel family protein [Ruminococcus sp. HUN007]|uniref:potassium channel family protein n=1 Tax=Ruminococcus sp. HUN007 TaxID=1514668 RepID=UPI001FA7A108|nr:potassium channel family protein [Ruminococcus sp. HUN007]